MRTIAAALAGVCCGAFAVYSVARWSELGEARLVTFVGASWAPADMNGSPETYDGEITVVNAGPGSVTLHAISGVRAGLSFQGHGRDQPLAPGEAGTVDVTATVDCAAAEADAPLAVEAEVRTADRRRRTVHVPMTYDATPWQDAAQRFCSVW